MLHLCCDYFFSPSISFHHISPLPPNMTRVHHLLFESPYETHLGANCSALNVFVLQRLENKQGKCTHALVFNTWKVFISIRSL